jgi:outer membrane protein assembly factor BamD
MKYLWYAVILSELILGPACSSGKKNLRDFKGSYLESARLNFEAGEEALKEGEYDKALGYFQFVKTRYPVSDYAVLSDLKIADTKFAQKRWLAAASAYEVFIRLHPQHVQTEYASFRVGVSYFHAVPEDFFLLPPKTARDQSFTQEALQAIERFVLHFPKSQHLAEAKLMETTLFSFLARHNHHVADYYVKRGRYQAALERHMAVVALYPETKEARESLCTAASILQDRLDDPEAAKELYFRILNENKDSPCMEEAQKTQDENL